MFHKSGEFGNPDKLRTIKPRGLQIKDASGPRVSSPHIRNPRKISKTKNGSAADDRVLRR